MLFDWLTACVAVERAINMVKGIGFKKSVSVWWAKRVFVLITIIVLGNTWYEPFIRQTITDPRAINRHTWCILSFRWSWLETYRLIVNLINLINTNETGPNRQNNCERLLRSVEKATTNVR